MAHILVVANQTLGGEQLLETLTERLKQPGEHTVTVVVPTAAAGSGAWSHTHEEDLRAAQARLDAAIKRFSQLGVPVAGEIGDARPVDATLDALRDHPDIDEIILSTLPPAVSRWLRLDVVSRLERAVRVPLTHVIGAPEAASIEATPGV